MYTAAELAALIKKAGNECVTEMEIQIEIEKILDPIIRDLPSRSHFGRATKLGGIPDALHGNVVIEYERPGKLGKKRGREEAIGQLQRYILQENPTASEADLSPLRRTVGIALDGRQIAFVRYRSAEWRKRYEQHSQLSFFEKELPAGFSVIGPHPIATENVDLLVGYLRSLVHFPLTPESLAQAFGPRSATARSMVANLYKKVQDSKQPRTDTFFGEWKRIFGIVYGQLKKAQPVARELASQFDIAGKVELKALLFAVHTYFALLMKLLAAEVMSLQRGSLLPSFIQPLSGMSLSDLREALTDLEEGSLFQRYGITNFLEGDFFSWYLRELDSELAGEIRALALQLSRFDPRTPYLAPEQSRDLLKKLYQYLVPAKLRHDLGEYYTPDWIAEAVLDKIGFEGKNDQRLLDPACGSGTFLIAALKKMKLWAHEETLPVSAKALAKRTISNICGFDLNPIAVIAARTNFLLSMGELIRLIRPLEIPIYMCDSILTPHVHRSQQSLQNPGFPITTREGVFVIPREFVSRGKVGQLATVLEESIRAATSARIFVERIRRELAIRDAESEKLLETLFNQLLHLERQDRNRIWARFIKNSFAPIFKRKSGFRFVVGNPPWVNWQSLAEEYKVATRGLWKDYGFFTQKGYKALVPAGTLDLAALFFYVCMDTYLAEDGVLGFVITQSLFQSHGAGEGFRRVTLPDEVPIQLLEAEDLVALNPFEGAQNRTALVFAKKGANTPKVLDYTIWRPSTEYHRLKRKTQFEPHQDEVLRVTSRHKWCATNIKPEDRTSPWMVAPKSFLGIADKLRGSTPLKARVGVHTFGANGVFWVKIIEPAGSRYSVVENYREGAKRKGRIESYQHRVENELIYPLLRGRDVSRWFSKPSLHIVVTHPPGDPKKPYAEDNFATDFPQAYEYLSRFEDLLADREMCKRLDLEWYGLGKMGPYVFSPYRLVWREQSARLTAAVIEAPKGSDNQIAIADHKLTLTAFSDRDSAHFYCACINSSPVRAFVRTHVITTQISTHLYETLRIPIFDASNELHARLASISKSAHAEARRASGGDLGAAQRIAELETTLDMLACKLWGLGRADLEEILSVLNFFGDKLEPPKKKVKAVLRISDSKSKALIRNS